MMRMFFHEIIAAGDDASFMEVCGQCRTSTFWHVGVAQMRGSCGGLMCDMDNIWMDGFDLVECHFC